MKSRMTLRKTCIVGVVSCLASIQIAQADGAKFGIELESEKDNRTGITNHAVTMIPGWQFSEDDLISSVELLVEKNRDMSANSDGFRAKEVKRFIRLRHDGEISDDFDYYVRGGVGRSTNTDRSFNYTYVEPGIEYKANDRWEWVLAARAVRATDGTPGQRLTKLYLGPSINLDKSNEVEFRYVKAHGDQDTRTWLIELVHQF